MDLLKQLRVVFIGIPDAGKSTLISSIIEYLYNKTISPDTLMNELEYSSGKDIYGNADTRTIKAAKIIMPYKDYEIMFIDAPGHIEYINQIISAINMSSIIVKIIDANRVKETEEYFNNYINKYVTNQHIIEITTHTKYNDEHNFATDKPNKQIAIQHLIEEIDNSKETLVDIEEEANDIVKKTLYNYNNPVLMFSGGKDSVVGYDLLKNYVNNIIFPESGYDFPELLEFINKRCMFAKRLRNIPEGATYDNTSVFDIHKHKANLNNKLEQMHDLLCVNYRASDEGVRSKDHYIKKGTHAYRFSPVFYFSEENIWRYIAKHNLSYCSLYHNGYRSLGDYPVTMPCMPNIDNMEGIIDYIHKHPFEERDGRAKQDKTEKYAMEKLRNIGFF